MPFQTLVKPKQPIRASNSVLFTHPQAVGGQKEPVELKAEPPNHTPPSFAAR
jgi:hypothetical protein